MHFLPFHLHERVLALISDPHPGCSLYYHTPKHTELHLIKVKMKLIKKKKKEMGCTILKAIAIVVEVSFVVAET